MKKKKAQKLKKKVSKKSPDKKTTVEIVVRSQEAPTAFLKESDLGPEKEGGKYMIPKTWVSERQVLKIIQKTPPQFVLKRPGKGGKNFDYVPGHYFKKALNYTFGWNWDFKLIKQEVFGVIGKDKWAQIVTTGELTVKDDKGHFITKGDNGKAEIKYMKDSLIPMDIGNDFKSSATDCLKRCAVQLGIASDVYGRMEYKNEGGYDVQPDKPTPPAPKQPETKVVPDYDHTDVDYICSKCGEDITKEEGQFSTKMFGKMLCRNDQKLLKEQNKK